MFSRHSPNLVDADLRVACHEDLLAQPSTASLTNVLNLVIEFLGCRNAGHGLGHAVVVITGCHASGIRR